MRRIILWVITFLNLSLLACTSEKKSEYNSYLHVALASPPSQLNPLFATDAYGVRIVRLIYNSLVKIGPDLRVIGDAAQSWSYDNLNYNFVLKGDLRFSNGDKLTPADIENSFAHFQESKSPYSSNLNLIESVSATEQDGQILVKIKLKSFSAKFITADLPVVKIFKIDKGKPIGTGSYTLEKETTNEVVLKARPHHPWAKAQNPGIVFKIVRDDFTRYQKIINKEIDIAQSEVPLLKIKALSQYPFLKIYKYPGLSFSYLLLNLQNKQLQNSELRRAIAMAIPYSEIIEHKLGGFAQKASSMLTPENPFFNRELLSYSYDPKAAAKLIEKLSPQPKLTLKTSNNREAYTNGKIIAHYLRKIGIQVEHKSYEWGTYYHDIKNGNYTLASMRWIGVIDPDIYRQTMHTSEKPPGRNRGYYSNNRLDVLLDKGVGIESFTERKALYDQVQSIVHSELPIIPLWYNKQVAVTQDYIQNYDPPANGDYSQFIFVSKNK